MSAFFDLIVVTSAAIFLWTGFKKGFFKSIIDLIIMIFSVLVPYLFAPSLAEYYYHNFIYSGLIGKINDILAQNDGLINSAKNILGLVSGIPNIFYGKSSFYGITINDILKALNSSGDKSAIIESILKPSIFHAITVVIFSLLSIATFTVLRLLFKYAFKLPRVTIFGFVDSILGLCMGALKFVVFMFIFVVAFKSVLLVAPRCDIVRDVNLGVDDSKVFKPIYNMNVDVLNDYLKSH